MDLKRVLKITKEQAKNFGNKLKTHFDWSIFSNNDFQTFTDKEISELTGICLHQVMVHRLKREIYRYKKCLRVHR